MVAKFPLFFQHRTSNDRIASRSYSGFAAGLGWEVLLDQQHRLSRKRFVRLATPSHLPDLQPS
jgi:hypothetical protein